MNTQPQNLKNLWDKAFINGENFVFYPYNALVQFLNRYIAKQISLGSFKPIYQPNSCDCAQLRALDFGCGVGRQTLLLSEFGIESYGIDISDSAITLAKDLSKQLNLKANFQSSNTQTLPFEDGFFDFSISCGAVLNCMPQSLAEHFLNEIARVTQKYCFLMLLGETKTPPLYTFESQDSTDTDSQFSPICYFSTLENIYDLVSRTPFKIIFLQESKEINHLNNISATYWNLILEK